MEPFCASSIVEMVRCHFFHRASVTPTRLAHSTSTVRRGWQLESVRTTCIAEPSHAYDATTCR
eukprot:2967108-Prymnesium_polylepis.1